jgi:heme/copper-type cytochrome/quinol oxidase subunit 2
MIVPIGLITVVVVVIVYTVIALCAYYTRKKQNDDAYGYAPVSNLNPPTYADSW